MISIDQALILGLQRLQANRPEEAAAIFGQVLALVPDHFDALHLSGLTARRQGERQTALNRFHRAAVLQPASPELFVNLGNILRDLRRFDEALTAFRRARILRPDFAPAHSGLASTLREQGRLEETSAAWRAATAAVPLDAELCNGLGNSLQELGQLEEAEAAYCRALAIDPCQTHAWANLGTTRRGRTLPDAAAACHRRALVVQPDFPGAWAGLGLALADLDQRQQAVACQQRALVLQPDFTGAWNNLGSARLSLNQLELAVAAMRRAIRIDPMAAVPHRNLGIALLVEGRLAAAWPEYEWRLRCPDSPARTDLPRPRWNGEALNGRTLLLHAEQGLGDVLHFVRYVPLAAARGGRVLVCAAAEFQRLFSSLDGMSAFIPAGTPVPAFDCHSPLLSLPGLFGTTLDTIPADVPYLHPPPVAARRWTRRLAALAGLRVGLVWAGSTGHGNDRNRSLPLTAFAPVAALPGVRLISIQKGPAAGQAGAPPAGMPLINLSPCIGDFADTAAIIAGLDLVITVDTSVAHLAGALGRPVWVLLPFSPDWRWLLHRSDSPWYPTMTLFRQERPGAWTPVIDRVLHHLRVLTGSAP